jgi:hypothetical protein
LCSKCDRNITLHGSYRNWGQKQTKLLERGRKKNIKREGETKKEKKESVEW